MRHLLALPSDTALRFALLIAALLGTATYLYDWIYLAIPSNSRIEQIALVRCNLGYQLLVDAHTPTASARQAFNQCMAPSQHWQAAWILGGAAVLLGVVLAGYLALPACRQHRRRLQAVGGAQGTPIRTCFDELSTKVAVAPPPNLLWDPLRRGNYVFGRVRRYAVVLDHAALTRYYTDRDTFRAVSLHELAHVRNEDVDRTAITLVAWPAFIAVALIPFGIAALFEPPPGVGGTLWRVVALAVFVYAVRSAVLRSRELLADARAAEWVGGPALRRLVGQDHGRRWLPTVANTHPRAVDRIRAIDKPLTLLRVSAWDAFAAGLVAAVAVAPLTQLAVLLVPGEIKLQAALTIAAGIVSPLVGGIIVIGIWRSTLSASEAGRPIGHAISRAGVFGASVAAGLVLGDAISITAVIRSEPRSVLTSALLHLGLGALLAVVLAALCCWVVLCVRMWSQSSGRSTSLRPAVVAATIVGSATTAVVLKAFFTASSFLSAAASVTRSVSDILDTAFPLGRAALGDYMTWPSVIGILLAVAALPLVLRTRRWRHNHSERRSIPTKGARTGSLSAGIWVGVLLILTLGGLTFAALTLGGGPPGSGSDAAARAAAHYADGYRRQAAVLCERQSPEAFEQKASAVARNLLVGKRDPTAPSFLRAITNAQVKLVRDAVALRGSASLERMPIFEAAGPSLAPAASLFVAYPSMGRQTAAIFEDLASATHALQNLGNYLTAPPAARRRAVGSALVALMPIGRRLHRHLVTLAGGRCT
jgi:Zn-dependent protease with chaperone function